MAALSALPRARSTRGPGCEHGSAEGLARRRSAQVGAAADGPRHHRQRPAHAALPVRRRLDAGAAHRRARELQGHGVHRARVQAARAQARGRQRHVLPGPAVRADRLRQRDRRGSSPAASPLTSKTRLDPDRARGDERVRRKADLDNVPTVFAGRWGDTTSRSTRRCSGARSRCSLGRRRRRGGRRWRRRRGGARRCLRCDSVPDKFGAAAAARGRSGRAADSAAAGGRAVAGGGGGGGRGAAARAARDTRAQARGRGGNSDRRARLDAAEPAVTAAFNGRGWHAAGGPRRRPAALGARRSRPPAAERLFGKPVDQLRSARPASR